MECRKILDCVDIINERVEPYDGYRTYLDTGGLQTDKIIDTREFDYNSKPSRANLNVQIGDIIFARMKETTKVKVIKSEESDYMVSTGFVVLRAKQEISDVNYLNHIFLSDYFQRGKDELCTGATQKAINNTNFKKLEIPLPQIDQQRLIAKILDAANAYRQKTKDLIEKYDELTQSLFLDMFGDPLTNPMQWERKKLNSFLNILVDVGSNGGNDWVSANIKMKDEEDYALMIRTVNLNKNDFKNNLKYVSEETYNLFKKTKVYGGEIIMNKIGSAGKFWLMPNLNRPVSLGLNQLMMTFDNLEKMFFYYYFSTDYGKRLINSKLNGATTKSITKTALRDLDVLYPPIKLQNIFAERVQAIEAQKALAYQELEKADDLYKSLLQKAVKGELV
ncbi:restriction endonuclease subunit S [Gelidibacter japonicus]|uniref:restriction endonuclease subunit S n=1 Tax=Gelidibacter japonicus TaxID=1962232 RepID=UPI003A94DC6D